VLCCGASRISNPHFPSVQREGVPILQKGIIPLEVGTSVTFGKNPLDLIIETTEKVYTLRSNELELTKKWLLLLTKKLDKVKEGTAVIKGTAAWLQKKGERGGYRKRYCVLETRSRYSFVHVSSAPVMNRLFQAFQ